MTGTTLAKHNPGNKNKKFIRRHVSLFKDKAFLS